MARFSSRLVALVVGSGFVAMLGATGACSSAEPETDDTFDAGAASSSGGRSSSSSSSGGSSSSSSGGSSSSSGASGGSSSGSAACNDPDDVGDMTSPEVLAPVSDGVDTLEDITGVISTDDEDAYKRAISDDWFGSVGPIASTVATNVQLCLFLECTTDRSVLTINGCGAGAVGFNYSDTIKGCCGNSINIDFACSGTNDSVNTYVRVRSTADQCKAYTVNTGQ